MKRGFTLIELLVYMLIMGFIIVVAGRVYSDSTSMRVRTQNMTAATEEMNKVAELIKEDMSQMGAKGYIEPSTDEFIIVDAVYQGSGDSSSFELEHRNALEDGNDKITFRKIVFDDEGNYTGVREVTWERIAADSTLQRSCIVETTDTDPDCDGTPVRMATGVRAFSLLPSSPAFPKEAEQENNLNFAATTSTYGDFCKPECSNDDNDDNPKSLSHDGKRVFGFYPNLDGGNTHKRSEISINDGDNCREYDFKIGQTYYVRFQTPIKEPKAGGHWTANKIISFRPGIDHAAIGFRTSAGDKIEDLPRDFLFYLPQTKEGNADTTYHYFEFSVPKNVTGACPVFTFAFYGRTAYGELFIDNFSVGIKDEDAYRFKRNNELDDDGNGYNTDTYATEADGEKLKNKKQVKAFELTLEIDRKGEIGSTRRLRNDENDGGGGFVITTPNNGIRPVRGNQ